MLKVRVVEANTGPFGLTYGHGGTHLSYHVIIVIVRMIDRLIHYID